MRHVLVIYREARNMNSKISKIEAIVLTSVLLGAAFWVPVNAIKVEQTKNSLDANINGIETQNSDNNDAVANLGPFELDRTYVMEPPLPDTTNGDNDDAGYKRDAGGEITHSNAIYPGEMVDDWPGRGRTGKLSSNDDEDWYFFSVCEGQDIVITLTPPSGYNFDLGLWDDDETERATSMNSGSIPELITFTADYTAKWYMRIHYISGLGEGQYSFDVTLDGQNDANSDGDAGDNFEDATLLTTTGVYYGYLDMEDEEDWYKFNVNQGQGIHFILEMKKVAYLSDFDIYLYNPGGILVHKETYYYDDELEYPADESGYWRIRIKIFPGYTDIPDPTEWEYWTYGSGAYKFEFGLEGSAAYPPGPVPQPQITPIAQTFKIANDPESNKDEYGYLASIPACNYLDGEERYLAPIVYTDDTTPTNWFGTVDDTTDYLLDDWNVYLSDNGKTAVEYNVPSDPVQAAADIATNCWNSSDLAVVAIDGSSYKDIAITVLNKTQTLKRNIDVKTIPNNSPKIMEIGGSYVYPMFLRPKWGAINVSIYGSSIPGGTIHIYPSLIELFPKFMSLGGDWWPKHADEPRYDIYYPVTTMGAWAAGVRAPLGDWDFKITKYQCHRHRIRVTDSNSVLKATVATTQPSDLLVFLVDPQGHVRAPDIPDWNGGPINPIHGWHGIDDGDPATPCDPWRNWNPDPHTEFSVEVLHPEKGMWTAIVVPRYGEGSSSIKYTITGKITKINQKRANAAVSAANAAVIASLEHAPLLYVTEDSIPSATANALSSLGVGNIILVERGGGITQTVKDGLPNIESDLTEIKQIIDHIKDYDASENYITITSIKTGDGYFAPAAMLAAYHGSPILRIGDAPENPAGLSNRIDTWRLWDGDYYHGNRAPGHLPIHDEPVPLISDFKLLIQLIKYFLSGGATGDLPPLGMDAKRYWNEKMYNGIHEWIEDYNLDIGGQEAYVFVAPRKDIRLELHAVMMGNNSYAGHIPGDTPAYTSDIIIRNVLYSALIYANPNRDVTTTQFMNFPDGGTWRTNDGVTHSVYSSRIIKNAFMSHDRTYDGHCLWDAHLERMNDGASVMYYSGHGTGGSGMSAQYLQTPYSNYPDQIWYDTWRGYMYDNWKTTRDNGRRWYNPEPPNLYDIIHYKWADQLLENLKSNAIFYQSCSTGQQFGPTVYLDHGAVMWYGNAGSGLCPEADLMDIWMFEDTMIYGIPVGPAYSKYVWLHFRDFTTGDPTSMYGSSSLYGEKGITNVPCIYGDPNLIIYSPEWTSPEPEDSPLFG